MLMVYLFDDDGKMLVLWTGDDGKNAIDLCDTNGRFVRSFGKGLLKNSAGIATDNQHRIFVLGSTGVQVFSEEGNQLSRHASFARKRIFTSEHGVPQEKRAYTHAWR